MLPVRRARRVERHDRTGRELGDDERTVIGLTFERTGSLMMVALSAPASTGRPAIASNRGPRRAGG